MSDACLIEASARELADLVRNRTVSAVEVIEAFLAEVERKNPHLNAIIRCDPQKARTEAEAADRRLAQGDPAPLLGVPFTVKDNVWVAGETISQGSLLFADFVAPADAVAVARIRRAGAVFLGITNCSEFACKGVTTNKLFGPTRNPWDLARTPGGSSGGAASAVAAGLGPLAICTDGGGSTRRPASHAGVVGFKPSGGLIPHPIGFREPVFQNAVIGLMGRQLADVAAALGTLAGPDPRDPMTYPHDGVGGIEANRPCSVEGLRIAFSPRLGLGFPVDPEVADQVAQAVHRLQEAGACVEACDPHWPQGTSEEALAPLQFAGLAALYGEEYRADPSQFDPDIAAQIARGLDLPGTAVTSALFLREELFRSLADFFKQFDLLITPTTPVTAWPLPELGPATIEGRPVTPRAHAVFTPIFNHTFLPACSVPCGLAGDGLPVGLQVIGRRFEDRLVARAACAVEAGTGNFFRKPRPLAVG